MLARGSLGNPWRFERLLGLREGEPSAEEVVERARVGDRLAPRSTSGPSAPVATCASSTPGTPTRLGLSKRGRGAAASTAPTTAEARTLIRASTYPIPA